MSVALFASSGDVFSVAIEAMSTHMANRVNRTLKDCPYVKPPMECMNCETRVMFYAPNVRQFIVNRGGQSLSAQDVLAILDANYSVNSFIFYTYIEDRDILEVFVGGCRNSAFAVQVMLTVVANESTAQSIWVAINPETPFFDEIVKHLVDNGFQDAKLTATTIAGEQMDKQAVSLLLDKDDAVVRPEEFAAAIGMRDKALAYTKICKFKVVVPSNVLDKIRTYLSEQKEYAGSLIITSYALSSEDGETIPVARLGFPIATETRGMFEAVIPPTSLFNFHTHPEHCYIKYGCVLGWPSNGDMRAVTYMRDGGNIIHFVVSVEGVYSIQVTPDFGAYLDRMRSQDFINYDECRSQFGQAVEHFFSPFNRKRVEQSSTLLNEYMTRINNVSIGEIVATAGKSHCHWLEPHYDFKIYNVLYSSWDFIAQDRGFVVMVNNSISPRDDCPPSINAEVDLIDSQELLQ